MSLLRAQVCNKSYIRIRKLVLLIVAWFLAVLIVGCATSTSPRQETSEAGGVERERGDADDRATGDSEFSNGSGRGLPPPERPLDIPPEDQRREDLRPLPPEGLDIDRTTIDRMIAAMNTSQLVGQLIIPAMIYDAAGAPIRRVTDEVRSLMEEVQPGGFLLFGENIESPGQVRDFVSELQSLSAIPLFIAVDQEGGIVRRVVPTASMPVTAIPSASRVGRSADPDLAYDLASVVARELAVLGINVNLAPVADVLTNPDNPAIGSRAFGSDPELVAEMVVATVKGLQANGVGSVIKHFPGHGDTIVDSHVGIASVSHSIARLTEVELVPFIRGIEAGADAVLTGHISVPAVTGDETPATLSGEITRGLLRDRLGFEGVIMTDALTMGALTNHYTFDEIVLGAFVAGADILLRPGDPQRAHATIMAAVEAGEIDIEEIRASVRRVLRMKIRRGLVSPPAPVRTNRDWTPVSLSADDEPTFFRRRDDNFEPAALGSLEHRAIADEVMKRSQQ